MTINKPSMNNSSCSTSKCVACNFRFVCASSPHCCIDNIRSNSDNSNNTEEILKLSKKIEELESFIAGFVNSQVSVVSGILEEFKNINSNMGVINNSVSESSKVISEKVKSVIDSIQQAKTLQEEFPESSGQIVPFDNQEEGKVLVEKKGVFGRTKWVEKKA